MTTMTQSLQQLLKPTLAVSQVVALFPVRGIMEGNSSKLRFHWCSPLVGYWLVVCIGLTIEMYLTCIVTDVRNPNGSLSAISNFYLVRAIVPPMVLFPLFLQLSRRWPMFIHLWELMEGRLVLQRPSQVLSRKIFIYTVSFATLRFFFFIGGYIVAGVRIVQCEGVTTLLDFINMLYQVRYPHIFSVTPPTFWKYLICTFLEFSSTLSWLCAELIVLHVSLVLLEKFKTFNGHLEQSTLKVSPHFWNIMRMEYVKLTILTNMADSLLSPFIFSLVIFETMLVTLFIYLVLTYAYTLLSYAYFLIFFLSHLGIDIVTLVTMATIFGESKKPLTVLHTLPSTAFCLEVRRLYTQVKRETVALTGCKFFVVTKTAILSIISALVTYEVLLVQLGNLKHEPDSSESTESNSQFCIWIEQYLKLKLSLK